MSDFQACTGTGRLIRGRIELATRYTLYRDASGRPILIELWDRPKGVFSDEHVRVVLSDGRELTCLMLDDTSMCTIVGDGI